MVSDPPIELLNAAIAVVERWDGPSWKDLPATANYIHRLRNAIVAMVVALLDQPPQQREIRLFNDDGAVKTMLAACDGLEDLEDCMRAVYHALSNEEYLRTIEPVSIASCVDAIKTTQRDGFTDYETVAKAVLDAAGVKYVD